MDSLKNIIHKIGQPTKVAGVEVILQSNASMIFQLVILEKKRDEIIIEKDKIDFNDFEELVNHLNAAIPIHLSINGKGILHKPLEDIYQNEHQLLQAVLPNAILENFVLQKTTRKNGIIASIIRKDTLEKIIQHFQDSKLWVTQVSLGAFDVSFLLPFLSDKAVINTSTHIIHFNPQEQITSFSKNEFIEDLFIKIGDDHLNHKSLVAYAVAFKTLVQVSSEIHSPLIENNQEEFLHHQIFKKMGVGVLATFFIILILNTFFYYQLKDKNQALSSQLFMQQGQLIQLDSLKEKLTRQEKFFNATNLHQNSKVSFYADRIAASVPKDIQFSKLEVFPTVKTQNGFDEEQLQEFKRNEILIKGFCKSSLTYNQWLKALKKMDWVKEVNHLDYKDVDSRLAEFEVKVII